MAERGLVVRQPAPGDARGALISLTGPGRATLAAARAHVASVREHVIGLLTPAEVAALDSIASKIITHRTGEPPAGLTPR
jgi:DNA-binding MarR family transcriptional regulator